MKEEILLHLSRIKSHFWCFFLSRQLLEGRLLKWTINDEIVFNWKVHFEKVMNFTIEIWFHFHFSLSLFSTRRDETFCQWNRICLVDWNCFDLFQFDTSRRIKIVSYRWIQCEICKTFLIPRPTMNFFKSWKNFSNWKFFLSTDDKVEWRVDRFRRWNQIWQVPLWKFVTFR